MRVISILVYVGDFYHKAETARAALVSALQDQLASGAVSLFIAASPEKFIAKLEERPVAAILFAEDRIAPESDPELRWLRPRHSDAITRYVEAGGGLLAWHSGLASYPEDSGFVKLLRGYFLSHPAEHSVVRYETALEWPTGKAGDSFELLDEHYFVACNEAETEVFLRSASRDGSSIAGWRHTIGNGRICCLTPAHRDDGLTDPAFLNVLMKAVNWTAGQQ